MSSALVLALTSLTALSLWHCYAKGVGCGGSLVDSSHFVRGVVCLNPTQSATLGKYFTRNCLWRFAVKLQYRICAATNEMCFSFLECYHKLHLLYFCLLIITL